MSFGDGTMSKPFGYPVPSRGRILSGVIRVDRGGADESDLPPVQVAVVINGNDTNEYLNKTRAQVQFLAKLS